VVIRRIVDDLLKQSNVSPENFYSELAAKLREEVERLKRQWIKEEEKNLDKAFERVEEQRRREAELGERLDQLKSMRMWTAPRLIEIAPEPLPRPRLIELPEPIWPAWWRWLGLPKPIELFSAERRREVPA